VSPRSPPPHRGALSVAGQVSGGGGWLIHHPSAVDCLASLLPRLGMAEATTLSTNVAFRTPKNGRPNECKASCARWRTPPPRVRRTWRTISLVAHPSQPQNPSGAGARGSHDTHRRSGYGLQTKYTLYLTAVPSANRLPAWSEKEAAAQPPAEAGGANSRKLGKRPYGTADLAQPCGAPCSGEASDAVLVWPR
jgi:hypothetical protein